MEGLGQLSAQIYVCTSCANLRQHGLGAGKREKDHQKAQDCSVGATDVKILENSSEWVLSLERRQRELFSILSHKT